jgi:FkbM family methyltransferase
MASVVQASKSLSRRILNRAGFKISRISRSGLQASLKNLSNLGFEPEWVFDIGAHEGSWTKTALRIWSQARYVLVEPQFDLPVVRGLEQLGQGQITWVRKGAGPRNETRVFNHHVRLDSGSFDERNPSMVTQTTMLEVVTLDSLMDEFKNDSSPTLLKLDCEGWDIEVLKGAKRLLPSVDVIYLEAAVANPFFQKNTMLSSLEYMMDHGFKVIDLIEAVRNPQTGVLWNAELCFVRADSEIYEKASNWQF